jgi:hypothetical protein
MTQLNMDAVKEQLRSLAADYERPLRGKFALLMPLREEIIQLERKGASTGEIAALLAQCQVAVSKDTVGRFLRMEKKERSSPRAKKTGGEAQPPGNESAAAKPMMPRLTPSVNL